MPSSPMKSEPEDGRSSPAGIFASFLEGLSPPSDHVTGSGPAVRGFAGKRKRTVSRVGQMCSLIPEFSAETEVGALRLRAVKTGSRMWHPKSPRAPEPKSCQSRQTKGW